MRWSNRRSGGTAGRSGDGNWTYTDYTTYYNVTTSFAATDDTPAYDLTLHPVAATTDFATPLTHSLTPTTGAETTSSAYVFYPSTL